MLLSRIAEHAYWLGRYLERAEAVSRAIVAHNRICLDMPRESECGFGPLLKLSGIEDDPYAPPSSSRRQERAAVLLSLVLDKHSRSSVVSVLGAARENLRACRALLPKESWDVLNPAYLALGDFERRLSMSSTLASLELVIAACQRISSQINESMLHDEAFSFIMLGRYLERADMLMRVIEVADEFSHDAKEQRFSNVRWMGLLHSLSAYQMFRRQQRGRIDAGSTLRFLVQSDKFPRSLRFCLEQLRRFLGELPNSELLRERAQNLQRFPLPSALGHPTAYAEHILRGLYELGEALEFHYFHEAIPSQTG